MRVKNTSGNFTAFAVAGTQIVHFGWDLPETDCQGLKGFAIERFGPDATDHRWLQGMKTFEETDPGTPKGELHDSIDHPVQSFWWSDYDASPGVNYTYKVHALKGTPSDLQKAYTVELNVTTEALSEGGQDIHFNRGITANQEYAHKFGNKRPDENNFDDPVWKWLSRGLYEAMVGFIRRAKNGDKLRFCAYEFHFLPILKEIKRAEERGVDIKIIYDAKKPLPDGFPIKANLPATKSAGIDHLCIQRKSMKSKISHNKFIIHYEGDVPTAVFTGGTNFSDGGIFGQSNVGRSVDDPNIANTYHELWEILKKDPQNKALKPLIEELTPTPQDLPPIGTIPMFSPRGSLDLLDWYANRAMAAQDALFMTFAFGMNDVFKLVYENSQTPLRFAVMDKNVRPQKAGPKKEAEVERMKQIRFQEENLVGIGSKFFKDHFDTWVKEKLTELNSHVRYIHNKFMLIDPLSDDPIVIGGSANFSSASTTGNDENMLITRGNTRVADIYFGEYMRLFNHHAFRNFVNNNGVEALNHLNLGDWWKSYFERKDRIRRRNYFSGKPYEV